jgi:hypothetical protein
MLLGPETGDQNARRIDSRESASVTSRPTLTVIWSVPSGVDVPLPLWSVVLLGMGLIWGTIRCRPA